LLLCASLPGAGGQARVFLPRLTSCFECSLVSMPAATGFAVCTIRNVPRIAEHAIAYALKVQWPLLESFNSCTDYKLYEKKDSSDEYQPAAVKLDKDDVQHMTWLYNRAEERAKQFGINGVTYNLTMQVVKNIIPAIASTNALISACCVNEALKFRSRCSFNLDNYFMYMGGQSTGTNTETIKYSKNPNCSVCHTPYIANINPNTTLQQFISSLEEWCSLVSPSIATTAGNIYYMKNLHLEYCHNLDKPIHQLFHSGQLLVTADKNRKTQKVLVVFEQE
jgi:ubiquitin-activating enzyme E1 C